MIFFFYFKNLKISEKKNFTDKNSYNATASDGFYSFGIFVDFVILFIFAAH